VRSQLRLPYADFLARYDWAIFGTLTFARDLSAPEAWGTLRSWARKLAKSLNKHVHVGVVMENTVGGRPHFHVLLHADLLPLDFDRDEARRLWFRASPQKSGNSRFTRFRPGPSGFHYMTKRGEPDLLVACSRPPRCRRAPGGCAEAPGCW